MAWPSFIRTSARSVVKLPSGVEPAAVAALADAGLTAYHAVKKAVPLLYPGSTCVVMGAGGLGHIGIQCLRAMSATRIVVLDRNEEALALTRDWGADETVSSTVATWTGCSSSPTATAPRSCSTSSGSRAPSATAGR